MARKKKRKQEWVPIKKTDGTEYKHEAFQKLQPDEKIVIHKTLKIK